MQPGTDNRDAGYHFETICLHVEYEGVRPCGRLAQDAFCQRIRRIDMPMKGVQVRVVIVRCEVMVECLSAP